MEMEMENQNTITDCAICLEPLKASNITLAC